MGDRIRLALGDLAADRTRTLLTVAALVPLVIAFFIVAAVAQGIRAASGRPAADLNLVITEQSFLDVATGTIDGAVLAAAAEVGGADIEAVSPMVFRVLLVESSDPRDDGSAESHVFQLRGAGVDTWPVQHGLELREGRWPAPVGEVVVTRPVLEVTGWEVGSEVTIFAGRFRISGVVAAPGTKAVSVWMPLPVAERLFDTAGVYQLAFLRLAPGADAVAVADRLAADPRIGARHAVVLESRLAFIEAEAVKAWSGMGAVNVAMALLLIGFGGFSFAAMTLQERRHEFGILRAVGLSAATVRSILVVRAATIATVAYAIGWTIAWVILRDGLTVDVFGLAVSIGVGLDTAAFGLLLTLAVTWLGARLATRRLLAVPVQSLLEH